MTVELPDVRSLLWLGLGLAALALSVALNWLQETAETNYRRPLLPCEERDGRQVRDLADEPY